MTPTDRRQYETTGNLSTRIGLHDKYGPKGGLATFHGELPILPGSRVLEVGCGTGRFWEQGAGVLPDGLRLVLTDPSPAMVESARERLSRLQRWPDAEMRIADVEALPFAASEFDVVLAMHMLYHAQDRVRALEEIARVLRPGGLLIVTTNGRENLRSLFELGHRSFGGPERDPGALSFGLEDVQAALAPCFDDVRLTVFEDSLRIDDPLDVVDYLASTPAGQRASPCQRGALASLVEDAFRRGEGAVVTTRITGFATAVRRP